MTSNLGSDLIIEDPELGEKTKALVSERLKSEF